MLMIKPRYLGDLVRLDPLHDFVMGKIKESQSKFKPCMDAEDMSAAAREVGKQEALLDVLHFISNMEWY